MLDPGAFAWTDAGWHAAASRDSVIYELHVGTFTPEGTFDAAIPHLRGLRELGVTAIEVMPVAEFPGRHGWGYDGVYLTAAHSAYGGPLGFSASSTPPTPQGLAVILDVVYNHLGASGVKAMEAFGPYFTDKHETLWGKAINFDDADSDPVREWVLQSAEELDPRLPRRRPAARRDPRDLDASARSTSSPRSRAACTRADPRALVIAESGLNDPKVMRPRSAAAGAATPPGPTTSTTRCACC